MKYQIEKCKGVFIRLLF